MPILSDIKVPPNPAVRTLSIKELRGVDLTSAVVEPKRSVESINMIRDTPGAVRKRMGYHKLHTYAGQINGIFMLKDKMIVHAGTRLYNGETQIYEGMADARSYGLRFNGKLYILDGTTYISVSEKDNVFTAKPVSETAKVPIITLSRAPNGGGTSFEPVNMLSAKRTDSFLATADATVYQLSFKDIDATTVEVKIRDKKGDWQPAVEGADFTVDRAAGTVTFTSAPGLSPVEGEDNVRITYAVTNEAYQNKVNKCRFSIAYGIEAASDRLFMSGNSEWGNYIWFSELNDPTYMGDIWYGVLGQEHSPVTGFSIITKQLAVHKREDDNERNIYLLYGILDEKQKPSFRITDIIQGKGAISPFTFGNIKEPMFLTSSGIYATTPLEYNNQRYVQSRGYFVQEPLLKEPNLENAYACTHKGFYMLAINSKVYILDSLVTTQDKTMRSNYYYEAFLWDNVPARVIYGNDEKVLFGDNAGNLFEFYTDTSLSTSFNDDGQPINARWDIDFSGEKFYLKKRVKYVAVRMASAPATSVVIYCRVRGAWRWLANSLGRARYLDFSQLQFSKFSFSCDTNPRTIGNKIKVKKFDAVRFSFRNNEINEPFGLYELALDFTEKGYYRR